VKHEFCPEEEKEQPFHPYFDLVEDSQWLFARLERVGGLSVIFYVRDVVTWTPEKRQRASKHLSLFELDTLYATQAADELLNMKYRLEQLYANGGTGSVRSHLEEAAVSRRNNHINSWQTALYEALSQDEQFCAGDFSQV
jgi:hypothetical protein